MDLDIQKNRKDKKYTRKEQIFRIFWVLGKILFCLTPRPMFGMRRWILRFFGARVGYNVNIYPSSRIYFPWNLEIGDWSSIGENAFVYNLGKVSIGKKVTISHNAHLCAGTHDYSDSSLPLIKPKITIEDQVWICADAFIGPSIKIGEGSVIGARAVMMKDGLSWSVYGGNPAKFIKKREINQ